MGKLNRALGGAVLFLILFSMVTTIGQNTDAEARRRRKVDTWGLPPISSGVAERKVVPREISTSTDPAARYAYSYALQIRAGRRSAAELVERVAKREGIWNQELVDREMNRSSSEAYDTRSRLAAVPVQAPARARARESEVPVCMPDDDQALVKVNPEVEDPPRREQVVTKTAGALAGTEVVKIEDKPPVTLNEFIRSWVHTVDASSDSIGEEWVEELPKIAREAGFQAEKCNIGLARGSKSGFRWVMLIGDSKKFYAFITPRTYVKMKARTLEQAKLEAPDHVPEPVLGSWRSAMRRVRGTTGRSD